MGNLPKTARRSGRVDETPDGAIPWPGDCREWPSVIEELRNEGGDRKPPTGALEELRWYRQQLAEKYKATRVYGTESDIQQAKQRRADIKKASLEIEKIMLDLMSLGGRSRLGPDILET